MKPADALRLKRARLTMEQRAAVRQGLANLERLYPQAMTRNGLFMDTAPDPVVVHELARQLRKLEGWVTDVQPLYADAVVHGGGETIVAFRLSLIPPPEAYDEADAAELD